MYLNHLMTDRELIDTAQYAENPHLRLLAERLDDKLRLIQDARNKIGDAYRINWTLVQARYVCELQDILER